MSKNIIWILVIGFVLGFISYEQLSNFSTTKGNASFWEIVSAILVPFVLAIWGAYSEHQKNRKEFDRIDRDAKELKRKEFRELALSYLQEKYVPFLFPKYKFNEKKDGNCFYENAYKQKLLSVLAMLTAYLTHLNNTLFFSPYAYMYKYLIFFEELSRKLLHSNLSRKDITTFYMLFSHNIENMRFHLTLTEENYQKYHLISLVSFVEDKGLIGNITMNLLKSDPEYSEYLKKVEELIENKTKKTRG